MNVTVEDPARLEFRDGLKAHPHFAGEHFLEWMAGEGKDRIIRRYKCGPIEQPETEGRKKRPGEAEAELGNDTIPNALR
jgi:hypothetical protein